MRRPKFLFAARPTQALLEAWLIGALLLFLLSLQVGIVGGAVLVNGVLFLCGVSGLWTVFRVQLPEGSLRRQVLWELIVAAALSLVMSIGLRLPAYFLRWDSVWLQSGSRGAEWATMLFLATGLGFLFARLGVRLWFLWQHLRRRRMLWAITNAHLMLVVLLACLSALLMFLTLPPLEIETLAQSESATLLTLVTERLMHTLFPALMAFIVMTLVTLLLLLPPSALFSYLVARRTTRRLEALVEAAQAFRQGRYDTRVQVQGEDEVAELQQDFNAMAGELEGTLHDLQVERDRVSDLLEARRELVANVSHELRTPVATVRASLESALGRWPETEPVDLRQDLEVMEGEIVRLQGLIDDLFILAQADAGGLAVDCRPLDVGPVLQRMVDAVAHLAWESGRVEVVADLASSLPPVCADEARLAQVMSNLLRNGIRHTPPGGIVAVMASAEEEAVRIEVRDTGEGIAAGDLPHIWDRFYRGENDQRRGTSGAGLGLALVKELTEVMGGTVDVKSTVGEGSCFIVRLSTNDEPPWSNN